MTVGEAPARVHVGGVYVITEVNTILPDDNLSLLVHYNRQPVNIVVRVVRVCHLY